MRASDATIDNRDNHLDTAGQTADRHHRARIGVDQTGCASDDGRTLWGTQR